MKVIESFCEGKFRDERNEDRIFVGTRHAAVIDGSSAAAPIAGRAGGIVAAEAIAQVLAKLPDEATIADFADTATSALRAAAAGGGASPYAAAVVYARARGEIWRIGDCPFAVDGVWNIPDLNPHERVFFAFRGMMTRGYARLARQPGDALSAATRDWLDMTTSLVNAGDDPFAMAALGGRLPPARSLEVFPVPEPARSIELASDGAVVSPSGQRAPRDVQDMLQQIQTLRAEDPACVELFPYWRGFLEGSHYLDDTTLLRLAL